MPIIGDKADLIEEVVLFSLGGYSELHLADKREAHLNVPRASQQFYNWEPEDVFTPRANLEVMYRTRRAFKLSTINRTWYGVAQRKAYSALSIDDLNDWAALAKRLASPIERATHGGGDTVGSLVLRLEVVTTDLGENRQTELLRILPLCPNLRCLSIAGNDIDGDGTLLTINSSFMLNLYDTFYDIRKQLKFLVLALHMDASASQKMMNTIPVLKELRCLYLFEDVEFEEDFIVPFIEGNLPHLHTVGVQCGGAGAFPFWRAVSRWQTRALKTAIFGGDSSLRTASIFWRDTSAEVTDVVVDSKGPITEFTVEVGGSVKRIMVPWHFARMNSPEGYNNVEEVYLTGRFDGETLFDNTQEEMSVLKRIVDDLLVEVDFPGLLFVHLHDVEVTDIIQSAWVIGDMVRWMTWRYRFLRQGVQFVDEFSRPLEMPLLSSFMEH